MLLGLATILAGSLGRNDPDISEPTFVGLILLWFFFALPILTLDTPRPQSTRYY